MRAAFCGTLVTPQVKVMVPGGTVIESAGAETMETKKSSDAPPVASVGGVISVPFLRTWKRIPHRQPCGTEERFATFIVNTRLLAVPTTVSVIGSESETDVMSC